MNLWVWGWGSKFGGYSCSLLKLSTAHPGGETGRVYHQQSSVKLKTANPKWEECFELPVARREDKLLQAVSPIGITDMEHLRSLIAHPNDAGDGATLCLSSGQKEHKG